MSTRPTIVSGFTYQPKVYDGTPTITPDPFPIPTLSLFSGISPSDFLNFVWGTPSVPLTTGNANANTYSITVDWPFTYTGIPPSKYTSPARGIVNVTISTRPPGPFSVGGVTGFGKTYDTTSIASTAGFPSALGLVGTDGVTAVMKANATNFIDGLGNPTSAAGTHSVAGVVALSGTNAANYSQQESSALLLSAQKTIAKANLPVTGLNAQSKVADGTTALTISGTPTVAPFSSDISNVTVTSYAAAFPSSAVGCYNITGSVVLGGTAAGNYTGSLTFTNMCITGSPAAPIPVRNAEHGNAAVMNDRYANAAQYSAPVGYKKTISSTELLKQRNGLFAARFIR